MFDSERPGYSAMPALSLMANITIHVGRNHSGFSEDNEDNGA